MHWEQTSPGQWVRKHWHRINKDGETAKCAVGRGSREREGPPISKGRGETDP